jgi:hypothetical protein
MEKSQTYSSFCIFTCIMGDYERLNEQPVSKDSNIDFICLTDNKDLVSKTWKILHVETLIEGDSVSCQRFIKISPERWLPSYKYSLYIDNSVVLHKIPYDIIGKFIHSDLMLGLSPHSFRKDVLEEFEAVSFLNLDFQERIFEQLDHYAVHFCRQLFAPLYWGGIILRNHEKSNILDFEQKWLSHFLRFSNRDQLSLAVLLSYYKIDVFSIDIDNNKSDFHTWPIVYARNKLSYTIDIGHQISLQEKIRKRISNIRRGDYSKQTITQEDKNFNISRNVHVVNGANNTNSGGSISFGIEEFSYADALAVIKGELVNKIAAELQGGLLFSTRPLGSAGQEMIGRVRIKHNGTLQIVPIHDAPLNPTIGDIYVDAKTGDFYVSTDGKNWKKILVEGS